MTSSASNGLTSIAHAVVPAQITPMFTDKSPPLAVQAAWYDELNSHGALEVKGGQMDLEAYHQWVLSKTDESTSVLSLQLDAKVASAGLTMEPAYRDFMFGQHLNSVLTAIKNIRARQGRRKGEDVFSKVTHVEVGFMLEDKQKKSVAELLPILTQAFENNALVREWYASSSLQWEMGDDHARTAINVYNQNLTESDFSLALSAERFHDHHQGHRQSEGLLSFTIRNQLVVQQWRFMDRQGFKGLKLFLDPTVKELKDPTQIVMHLRVILGCLDRKRQVYGNERLPAINTLQGITLIIGEKDQAAHLTQGVRLLADTDSFFQSVDVDCILVSDGRQETLVKTHHLHPPFSKAQIDILIDG